MKASAIDNPLRRRFRPPDATAIRHGLEPGMTVLEVGPGNGRYSVAAARRIGPTGRLYAVDIEPKMIERVQRRAAAVKGTERHAMSYKINTIALSLPMRMGSVNCFLVAVEDGFVLFDAGGSNQRAELQRQLDQAGCRPGNLRLIVLTHGDFDHSGNAAHLRQAFGAPVAMHAGDVGMVERGDMSWNRSTSKLVLKAISLLFGFGRAERFTPDVLLRDGDDLLAYGLDARVIHLPGHSLGSIGILLAGGDLIGGDLLENTKGPALNSIMDDRTAAAASVDKLKGYSIGTVYPGHGQPFLLSTFLVQQ